ncbi:MAG TPA: MFS transporter [Thermoanaerobaculia bacterium]
MRVAAEQAAKQERLGRNVVTLGGVSLLTDVATEMAYPLLPIFLTTVLGASATALGAIEGVAESTASLLKLASGWLSDRLPGRKPLVVIGYGLASLVKPLIGLTRSAGQVLAIRVVDRVGKGIRTSPRDALIADSVAPSIRGRAFGFHRAADNTGAVIGPLIAFALLRFGHGIDLRRVFLLTAIPAALSVALLVFGLREVPRPARPEGEGTARPAGPLRAAGLGARFWWLFAILTVFTLGNSSDAFLLLRATQLGIAPLLVPVLWALLNLVKALFNVPGGVLSDRFGRRPLLVAGWTIYAAVYVGFGLAGAAWQVWVLFAAYGLYFGATEGVEKALVADFVPAERRGAAFGFYNLALGIAALPASLIFGELVDHASSRIAFLFGGGMALLAAIAICFVAPPGRKRMQQPA